MSRLLGASAVPRKEVYLTRSPLWETFINANGYYSLQGFASDNGLNHFHDIAIRTNKYKLIHRLSREAQKRWSCLGILSGITVNLDEYELYNIQLDKDEKHNIYSENKSHPEIIDLRDKLNAWEKKNRSSSPLPDSKPEIQPYF